VTQVQAQAADDTTTTAPVVVDERNFRPESLDDFIGQGSIKRTLSLMLRSAKKRQTVLEHICFYGGPGLGKTTLAAIIAGEMGGTLRELAAPAIQKPGDLVTILALLNPGDVLFLDEIHALRREIAEILYSAMEDFRVTIVLKEQQEPLRMNLRRFTLAGATTDYGLLPEPLRARFGQIFALDLYTQDELEQVVGRAADKLGVLIDAESMSMIASRARGTPRVALRLLRRCYDLAIDLETDLFAEVTQEALARLNIDALGLDDADRRYLAALVNVYAGGPVGPKALAASSGLDMATLEQAVEPWLVRVGLVARTRKGRQVTQLGYNHIAPLITSGTSVAPEAVTDPEVDEDEDDI